MKKYSYATEYLEEKLQDIEKSKEAIHGLKKEQEEIKTQLGYATDSYIYFPVSSLPRFKDYNPFEIKKPNISVSDRLDQLCKYLGVEIVRREKEEYIEVRKVVKKATK